MTIDAHVEKPPRIVLAGLPQMVADFIGNALGDTGMTVMAARNFRDSVHLVNDHEGSVVVIVPKESTGLQDAYTEMLSRKQSLRCITVSALPDRTDLFELRLLGTNVGRHGVVSAIQEAIAASSGKNPRASTDGA